MSEPHADSLLPVTKDPGFNYWELLSRIVVAGLLLSSIGLLWWSYYGVFVPRLKESRDINATVARLTAEVDELNRQWPPDKIGQLNQKFALVQPRLFASPSELENWLGGVC